MSVFNELKRRNVFRVGFAYLIGSWLLAQISELLLDTFNAPEWTMQFIVVVLIIGFPIAVFFAWAFELTPDGVKRESEVDRSQSIAQETGQKLNRSIIFILVVALTYFVWESRFEEAESDPTSQQASETTNSAEEEIAPALIEAVEVEPVISRQSIAVLPFANRSKKEDDGFFVEGMHDDLLTNLARIGSLKVISRTSVLRYKDTQQPIPEIAAELGVATILEGAVQRSGDMVRINVQLIDAMTDEHLWAEIFDRELNTDNLFAIQSEISEAIASALEATLTDEEQAQIRRKPTDNLAAYHAFVRGRHLQEKRASAALEQAVSEFRQAVELDPMFAEAWVGLADSLMLFSAYGTQVTDVAYEQASAAIDRALEINPFLGEAHTSRASLLNRTFAPWADVEAEYKLAIEFSPNYARAFHWYANALLSQPARLSDALTLARKSVELDPMSPVLRANLADIYLELGEFEKAEAGYLELLTLEPDFAPAFNSLAYLNADVYGRFDESLKWLRKAQNLDPGNIGSIYTEFESMIYLREAENIESIEKLEAESIKNMENIDPDSPMTLLALMVQNRVAQRYAAAAEQANYLSNIPGFQWFSGVILAEGGNYERARELMLADEPGYIDKEQWGRLLAERQTTACEIGWVLMKTGDETLGHDLIQQAITYLTETLPQYIKHADRYSIQICYAALGDTQSALDAMDVLLAHNHIHSLLLPYFWPPIRELWDEPRLIAIKGQFKEQMARQRQVVEAMYAEDGSNP